MSYLIDESTLPVEVVNELEEQRAVRARTAFEDTLLDLLRNNLRVDVSTSSDYYGGSIVTVSLYYSEHQLSQEYFTL